MSAPLGTQAAVLEARDAWMRSEGSKEAYRALQEARRAFRMRDARVYNRGDMERAWREGALWAVEEAGIRQPFLAPGDNPYEGIDDDHHAAFSTP